MASVRTIVCILIIRSSVLGVTYPPLSSYHEDDSAFYFHKFRPEIFYDNKVLPEKIEVDIFVYKDHVKRVFFLVEREASPVELIVTPCSAPVEWRLLLRRYPTTSGQDEHEPWHNQVPNDGDADNPVILMTYTGSERRTFYRGKSTTGLYVLELDSKDHDTNAKVFLSTGHRSIVSPYPELPDGAKVSVVRARRNSAFLTWEPSYTQDIRYCVAVNEVRSLRSVCSAQGVMGGETPPTPPPSAGFGFWWERMVRKKLESKEMTSGEKIKISMDCIGKKTWYKVRHLHESRKYFFDVFAIDTKSNLSTAYKGSSAFTKSVVGDNRLKRNAMIPLTLNRNNSYSAKLDFHISSRLPVFWLFVQSCSGPGPVRVIIIGSQKTSLDALVMDFKTFSIPGLKNGSYAITVHSEVPTNRRVHVWFSRKYHRYPFPSLPDDKEIQVFETLTTCTSVTLSWKTTSDEKVKYCLYRKVARDNLTETGNTCRAPSTEGKDRILCKRYHRFSRYRFNNVIVQKVTGLRPGTTYVFDMFVTKCRGRTLAYDPVWVTTSKDCDAQTTNR